MSDFELDRLASELTQVEIHRTVQKIQRCLAYFEQARMQLPKPEKDNIHTELNPALRNDGLLLFMQHYCDRSYIKPIWMNKNADKIIQKYVSISETQYELIDIVVIEENVDEIYSQHLAECSKAWKKVGYKMGDNPKISIYGYRELRAGSNFMKGAFNYHAGGDYSKLIAICKFPQNYDFGLQPYPITPIWSGAQDSRHKTGILDAYTNHNYGYNYDQDLQQPYETRHEFELRILQIIEKRAIEIVDRIKHVVRFKQHILDGEQWSPVSPREEANL